MTGGEWDVLDPYSFGPVLGPMDDYYIGEGSHLRLFDKLGAHAIEFEGVSGTHFAVWAPNAQRVSVVGPFNEWDGRRHPMRCRLDTGIWEVFIPLVGPGEVYKYEIVGPNGKLRPLKADPFARQSEMRPKTASVVADPDAVRVDRRRLHGGARQEGLAARSRCRSTRCIWARWRRRADGGFMSYDQLAEQLIPYAADLGFTHIELLPITEHPFDPSWGYQPTGLYAPTARFGDPAGFARFVDAAHKAGLGRHPRLGAGAFPDRRASGSRASTARRSTSMPIRGRATTRTGTRRSTISGARKWSSFLVNNALYWLEKFHLDGLRVDAVASMLYLDYSRKAGEWVPNQFGGNHNLEAVDVPAAGQCRGLSAASGRDDDRRGIDLLERRLARRPTRAGSASASSGTWGS